MRLDQSCRPDGPPGLLAEGTCYSARDRDSGSTVPNLLDTVAVSRSVTDAPGSSRFDRGSAYQNLTSGHARWAMRPSSRTGASEGRWHARTTPGPGYQVSGRTIRTGVVRSAAMSHLLAPLRFAVLAAAVALAAGCSTNTSASFDPSGPCTGDGSAAGAYPELEALIPTSYEDRAPDRLDSGRNCSDENLGSLAERGIEEIRFAGGTWEFGSDIAAVLAVFEADGLTVETLADWWESTAQGSSRTQILGVTDVEVDGRTVRRLDTKTGERVQSVLVWEGAEPGQVNVVLSHNLPDPKIEAGVAAFGD